MILQTGIEDVERELFHGTNKNVVDAICGDNFDFPDIKLLSYVIQLDIFMLGTINTRTIAHDLPANSNKHITSNLNQIVVFYSQTGTKIR